MKTTIRQAILALACAAAATSSARLGETESQCETRYGKPVSMGKADESGLKHSTYQSGGFEITVDFLKGVAEKMYFRKRPVDPTEEEMNILLEANAQGHKWQQTERGDAVTRWRRDDGAEAWFSPFSAALGIQTKAYTDFEAKKKNPQLKNF